MDLKHTHGGCAGKSLVQIMEENLDNAAKAYLALDVDSGPDEEAYVVGELRGSARALLTWRNPYYRQDESALVEIERESIGRVGETRE